MNPLPIGRGFVLLNCDVNGITDFQLLIRHFQCQGAWCLCTADNDNQLAVEKFHRWLLEGFQTLGIAVADGFEGACSADLEGELIIGLRYQCALGIGE